MKAIICEVCVITKRLKNLLITKFQLDLEIAQDFYKQFDK